MPRPAPLLPLLLLLALCPTNAAGRALLQWNLDSVWSGIASQSTPGTSAKAIANAVATVEEGIAAASASASATSSTGALPALPDLSAVLLPSLLVPVLDVPTNPIAFKLNLSALAQPAAPATTAAPVAPSTAASYATSRCPDPQAALGEHNTLRALVGTPALSWSDALAGQAQSWSQGCRFAHSGTSYGENLAAGTAITTCAAGIKLWAAERPLYAGTFTEASGHYSQMVWRATTEVGCGFAQCSFGGYVTCLYSPPGNILGAGQFEANVPA